MTVAPPLPVRRPAPPPDSADDHLPAWERDALRKLRLLRAGKKPAFLFMSENGAILIYRGEPAGVIAPPA